MTTATMTTATMTTVTLSVDPQAGVTGRALGALSGSPQGSRISFASAALLWQVLTPDRWAILAAMTGRGWMEAAEAESLSPTRSPSHDDVGALVAAGLLDEDGEGRVAFPFDAVHVDFVLTKAA